MVGLLRLGGEYVAVAVGIWNVIGGVVLASPHQLGSQNPTEAFLLFRRADESTEPGVSIDSDTGCPIDQSVCPASEGCCRKGEVCCSFGCCPDDASGCDDKEKRCLFRNRATERPASACGGGYYQCNESLKPNSECCFRGQFCVAAKENRPKDPCDNIKELEKLRSSVRAKLSSSSTRTTRSTTSPTTTRSTSSTSRTTDVDQAPLIETSPSRNSTSRTASTTSKTSTSTTASESESELRPTLDLPIPTEETPPPTTRTTTHILIPTSRTTLPPAPPSAPPLPPSDASSTTASIPKRTFIGIALGSFFGLLLFVIAGIVLGRMAVAAVKKKKKEMDRFTAKSGDLRDFRFAKHIESEYSDSPIPIGARI